MDDIVVTGLRTGMPTHPQAVRRVKSVVGAYPVGVASGVSPANVAELLEAGAEFFMVASSLQDDHKRIRRKKVELLIASLLH